MKYGSNSALEAAPRPRLEDSRRFALKRATDAAHTRVEGIIGAAGMFAGVDGYRRYLAATLEIRTRYESMMDVSGAEAVWRAWPGRRVAHLVARDLADLGGTSGAAEKYVGQPLKPAELLGALYVLEGSSLGARVLSKSVSAFGLSDTYGARHLWAQAGEPGVWRDFVDMLETSDVAPCHATAVQAFEDFADAYQRAAL